MAVYENLSDDECALLAILQDESGLDIAEFAYTNEEDKVNGVFRAWPFQWAWWRCEDELQIDAGSRCLSAGTLVLTEHGQVPIESVQVGVRVLTHTGEWKRVTEVFDNGVRNTVTMRGWGNQSGLTLTPDHSLYARHTSRASKPKDGHKGAKMADPEWIAVEDFRESDNSGTMATRWSFPAEVDALEVPAFPESYRSGQQNIPSELLSEEFMWLLGIYFAEGSSFVGEQYAKVQLAIHQDEVPEVLRRVERVGLNASAIDSDRDLSAKIQINSRPLATWLKDNASGTARDKCLPSFVFGLDSHLREALLDGMVYGDGHVRPSGRIEYSTSSQALALSVQILAHTLGYYASVTHNPPPSPWEFYGRIIQGGDSYTINISERSNRADSDAGKIWAAVSPAEPSGEASTYDLSVEDDHSFVANGVVVHNSAGKSMSIKFKAVAFPFNRPGGQMVVTAPEGNHLDAITDVIETAFQDNTLFKEMLASGRGGIKHRPFKINFANGAVLHGRIPKHDGSGVKGIHPDWLEHDEASDYPESGWVELFETLKKKQEGDSRWRAHGVTRGIGGTFDEKCKPDSGWTVHRIPAMYRPTWDEDERAQKILQYGSSDNVDYRRNILGLPGDQNSPIFVLRRLMQNVDTDGSSEYNVDEYINITIDEAQVRESFDGILGLMELSPAHTQKYKRFWIGMDVGWTQAPSAIVVFGEETVKGKPSKLRLVTRIMLKQIRTEDQIAAILHLFEFYRPISFALDATGAGFPLLQVLQKDIKENPAIKPLLDRMQGYNFSAKVVAAFDESVVIDEDDPDGWKEAAIMRNVLEWSTDVCRGLVDDNRLILPFDRQLIGEFQGQTWSYARSAMDAYGRKKIYSSGQFHTLDAVRMALLAHQQEAIDMFISAQEDSWEAPDMIIL